MFFTSFAIFIFFKIPCNSFLFARLCFNFPRLYFMLESHSLVHSQTSLIQSFALPNFNPVQGRGWRLALELSGCYRKHNNRVKLPQAGTRRRGLLVSKNYLFSHPYSHLLASIFIIPRFVTIWFLFSIPCLCSSSNLYISSLCQRSKVWFLKSYN